MGGISGSHRPGGDHLLLVLGEDGECTRTPELKGNLTPGCGPNRGSIRAPRPASGSNSVPTKTATLAGGTEPSLAASRRGNAWPLPSFVATVREMVEQGQRVGLTATKLRGHIEDRGGLRLPGAGKLLRNPSNSAWLRSTAGNCACPGANSAKAACGAERFEFLR